MSHWPIHVHALLLCRLPKLLLVNFFLSFHLSRPILPSSSLSSSLLVRPSFTFLQATLVNRSLSYGTISLLRLLQSIHNSQFTIQTHVPSPSFYDFTASVFQPTYHSLACENSELHLQPHLYIYLLISLDSNRSHAFVESHAT